MVELQPGLRYEKLTLIRFDHKDERHYKYWLCQCECGKQIIVRADNLKSKVSCGCFRREPGARKPTPFTEAFVETCSRFWSLVDRSNDCWVWKGSKGPKGYGLFSFQSRNIRAHRFAYQLLNGKIPEGMMICHTCDNPPCCNPAHLFAGTAKDNVQDMIVKGRKWRRPAGPKIKRNRPKSLKPARFQKGLLNPFGKLSDEQKQQIRDLYDMMPVPQPPGFVTTLAEQFNVSSATIYRVAKYERRN